MFSPLASVQTLGLVAAASADRIEKTKLLYLGAAFAATWIAIAAYMFWVFRRQQRLEATMEKIQAQANEERSKLASENKTDR